MEDSVVDAEKGHEHDLAKEDSAQGAEVSGEVGDLAERAAGVSAVLESVCVDRPIDGGEAGSCGVDVVSSVELEVDPLQLMTSCVSEDLQIEVQVVCGSAACLKVSAVALQGPVDDVRCVRSFDKDVKIGFVPLGSDGDRFVEVDSEHGVVRVDIGTDDVWSNEPSANIWALRGSSLALPTPFNFAVCITTVIGLKVSIITFVPANVVARATYLFACIEGKRTTSCALAVPLNSVVLWLRTAVSRVHVVVFTLLFANSIDISRDLNTYIFRPFSTSTTCPAWLYITEVIASIQVCDVSIITWPEPKVKSISTNLPACVFRCRTSIEAIPTPLDSAIRIASVSIQVVRIITFVHSKVPSISTELHANICLYNITRQRVSYTSSTVPTFLYFTKL